MGKPLYGQKVAILIANGFSEQDMTEAQRKLSEAGANVRIIGMDHGLVNGWNGEAWGHHFAADNVLSSALAADYSVLVIPGGQKSIDKLKLTAHTKRFISGFVDAGKPIAVMGDAIDLLVFVEKVAGRTVGGEVLVKDSAEQAGASWSEDRIVIDGNLLTGKTAGLDIKLYAQAMVDHFVNDISPLQEVA